MPEGINTDSNEEREKSLRRQITQLGMRMGTIDRTIQAETAKKGSADPSILQLRILQDTNTVRLKDLNEQMENIQKKQAKE